MPLQPGNSRAVKSANIEEFHQGKTYAHTEAKFGKKRADAQAVAASLENARRHPMKGGGKVPDKEVNPKKEKGYSEGGVVQAKGNTQYTPCYRRII